MLFAEPQRTQFDLHFSVLGFPVRIHPFFWLMAVVLGFPRGPAIEGHNRGLELLIWVGVLLLSILVHELGHALMMRRLGERARIVLYMLGGLAIRDEFRDSWNLGSHGKYGGGGARTPWEQIAVSFAGPGAGFVLAAVVIGLLYLLGGHMGFHGRFPFFYISGIENFNLGLLLGLMIYVNLIWGMVNLFPVFPLDGGQIAQALFSVNDPWDGVRKSLMLSLGTAIGLAACGLLLAIQAEDKTSGIFIVIMFGSLAYSSYQALQQMGGGGGRPW